jgi:excinuclease UvrABC nuclease subunit
MDEQLKQKVGEFLKKLNLPEVCTINTPYDITKHYRRDNPWGSANQSGVYAFYSNSNELLYIGSSVNIGSRLGNYFQYSSIEGSAESTDIKSEDVRWVVTIGIKREYWFLSCALEQYLIYGLKPPRNKNFKL